MLSSLRSNVIQGAKRMGIQRTVAIASHAPAALLWQFNRAGAGSCPLIQSEFSFRFAGAHQCSSRQARTGDDLISLQQVKEIDL
jgi:hypothetical protein